MGGPCLHGGVIALAACGNGSSGRGSNANLNTGEPLACDPFIGVYKPISVGTVLGAGKDHAGTLYIADQASGVGDNHVFVSKDGSLHRQRIAGSGKMAKLCTRSW